MNVLIRPRSGAVRSPRDGSDVADKNSISISAATGIHWSNPVQSPCALIFVLIAMEVWLAKEL
jgi:hypothetical protein